MSKTYVIGDIHGELYRLKVLFDKLPVEPEDTICCLGDYIDRGWDSKKVVDFLIEKSFQYNMVFLKGNHEDMMLEELIDDYTDRPVYQHGCWFGNGGNTTLESYGVDDWESFPEIHKVFFESLKPYHETEDWYFVHAGLTKNLPENDEPFYMMWHRYVFPDQEYRLDKNIVYGHSVVKTIAPITSRNGYKMVNIDTGCGKRGYLSAICLETMETWCA